MKVSREKDEEKMRKKGSETVKGKIGKKWINGHKSPNFNLIFNT